MAALIDTIILPDTMERYRCGNSEWRDMRLGPLGKINIFVGANNTGKSWAMRLLCGVPPRSQQAIPRFGEWQEPETFNWNNVRSQIDEFRRLIKTDDIKLPAEFSNELDTLAVAEPKLFNNQAKARALRFSALLSNLQAVSAHNLSNTRLPHFNQFLKRFGLDKFQNLPQRIQEFSTTPELQKIYIPTLRSLRKIGFDSDSIEGVIDRIQGRKDLRVFHQAIDDIFQQLTRKQYFKELNHVSIFTGQSLYGDLESLLRGDLSSRKKLQRFEMFLSEKFFQNESVALIPRKNEEEVTIKIGHEEERPVHQLGDGIQMILLLIYPLFQRSDQRLLAFIEEPELFLHPWLQRIFVELLASDSFPNHQYFLTTHSNHLLDLAMDVKDVSIFSFEKELELNDSLERKPRFRISNISREDRKPLDLLGVRNSSVLLSNCTIWVEGITDRRYLSHWLHLYQESLKVLHGEDRLTIYREDLHFSFVEYGGGNITHWSFLDDTPDPIDVNRLCGTLFLITDSDSAKNGKKAERHKKLDERLSSNYCCLPVREIENLLAPEILKSVLVAFNEDKASLPEFKQADYEGCPLGEFIEGTLLKNGKARKRKGSYKAASGTITEKVKFCELANSSILKWEDLSEPAQKLVERLYRFIESNNKGR